MSADVAFAPVDAQATLVEVAEHLVDGSTLLLAVTGSLSNGSWKRAGAISMCFSSDVSCLQDGMERRSGALTIKSAARVSAYLEAEITAGLLPPRVINALRLVAQDGCSVIVRASAWDQPDFGLEVGARASLRDLLPTARLTSITRITTVLAFGWQYRLATERYRSTEGSRSQTAEWARSAWFRYRSLTVRSSSSYDRSRCHWLPSTTNALN